MTRDTNVAPRLAALHLVALWSVAVAQPIFDVVGRNPEFFVAHATRPANLVGFVLLLCLGGPACGVALLGVAGRLGPGARQIALWTTVGLLVAAVILQAVKLLADWPAAVSIGLAVVAGALAATAYLRLSPVRLFMMFLSPAALVIPVAFLLRPPISGLLTATDPEPLEDIAFATTPPIAMIVFDQLPLVSLLDRDREIDEALYPNFASFARNAAWFRNASALSGMTESAIPTILTGINPAPGRLPMADVYPNNLFTLLGSRYRLQVMEPLTKLCPETICDYARQPSVRWWRSVLRDLWVVYRYLVLPDELTTALPPVTQNWKDFAATDDLLGRWNESRTEDRGRVVNEFLDSLRASSPDGPPPFFFSHILLPHEPWVYLPSGQTFTADVHMVLGRDGKWADDEWAVARSYQRHLLQVQYADTVLGAFLQRLEDTGHYDEALVIVAADHGASFIPGASFRTPTQASFADIASVPLLIKRPHQRAGGIVDRNVSMADLVPTLADELGVTLPWQTDGLSVFDTGREARKKVVYYNDARQRMERPAGLEDVIAERVARKFALFGTGDPYDEIRLSAHADLVGRRVDDFVVRRASGLEATLDFPTLFDNVDPRADFVPAHIKGAVMGRPGPPGPPLLAVALNGVIAGVTQPYAFRVKGRSNMWEVIVDPRVLKRGANSVEVFGIREEADGSVALDAAYTGASGATANLLRDEAAYLWGVTLSGFFNTEWAGPRPFRWTDGDATMSIPIDGREPPGWLAIDVLMTGSRTKPVVITANGCTIFDAEIGGRWIQKLSLAPCTATSSVLEINVVSDVHQARGSDRRSLGVAISSIELLE